MTLFQVVFQSQCCIVALFVTSLLHGSSSAYKSSPVDPLRGSMVFRRDHTTSRRFTYDLGLGKNAPVTEQVDIGAGTGWVQPEDTYEAVRFLEEHQATRNFPPPLSDEHQVHSSKMPSAAVPGAKKVPAKKLQPVVQPKRVLEDVLIVLDSEQPTMILPTSHKLDVNSVWVEMLLHHQLNASIV